MTHQEIRQKFLDYFSSHDHTVVASSSLVPSSIDESVLLTTAGMQQFKPYLMGEADALEAFGNIRLASIQKCFRTSDVEEVGDESHHTFFEMLGNFSVGDYFKDVAIPLAWNFLTQELKLDPKRMFVSIFAGEPGIPKDKEATEIWKREVPGIEIREQGREDNFWGPPGGKTGPCGPCSEIYYVLDSGKEIELWNLVFMEYLKDEEGNFTKLKQQNIDTGMGLERLVLILQKKDNVFETDLFSPLLETLHQLTHLVEHKNDLKPEQLRSLRIIADHVRGGVFLVGDGVTPLNVGRGYVLRRVLRRAILHGRLLGIEGYFLLEPVRKVIEMYGEIYPELAAREKEIQAVIEEEEQKFSRSLSQGLKVMEKMGKKVDAFVLYDTYGFPLELTQELAKSQGLKIDEADFEKKLEEQKERARSAAKKREGEAEQIAPQHTAAHLLNAALRTVLGPQVHQAGQHLEVDKFRHDFTFDRKLDDADLKKIESLVNEKIRENLPVKRVVTTFEEAKKLGAEAQFSEKYAQVKEISLYHVGDDPKSAFSKELCGGPHVAHTSQLGRFEIIKEESAGSGVRRIYGRAVPFASET
ncbi:alanine--tRNA ligase [candidate division WWE3 bacterium RBG_19FT_COMBO_53_11]|uniref:Alanine--tRNA ligase n=1 Tax=candidate division WWE3 bacterium RBG_19FT_COMBO_53_11 TaxID=1802613 RepID=A0A1F4UHF9_UNCKA|nr:MAG: alanine--tRNA ligase [candidate division WWE3 bacterium RBG_19FT_COMBO_53_11]